MWLQGAAAFLAVGALVLIAGASTQRVALQQDFSRVNQVRRALRCGLVLQCAQVSHTACGLAYCLLHDFRACISRGGTLMECMATPAPVCRRMLCWRQLFAPTGPLR